MRVALYARVSTEEQALHGLSIDAQLSALREAYPNGEEYVDLGISARKPILKRPELQRLLRDVEKGQIDLVVFCRLDRWTRNIREYYKAQDVLDAYNVPWRALQEDYETQTAAGRLKVNIMLAVAQDEADRTSERIKAVFEDKRRKGLVPTGSVPLGVKLENGKYAPSEDADRARELFQTFLLTRSVTETAKRFGWSGNGVRYALRNRLYADLGIVDAQTWETAQNVLQSRSQRHVRTDRVYLFSGLIICPNCGSRLTCVRVSGHTYYRCPRHYDGNCPGCHVSELKLERYLLDHLLTGVDDINLKLKKKRKKTVDVAQLRKRMDKLTDLYMNDLISREKYADEYKSIQTAIEEAEREQKPIDKREIKDALSGYKLLTANGKRIFWQTLLKSITPTEEGFDFALNYT